jgi:rhodanese-related sulfurtransferase
MPRRLWLLHTSRALALALAATPLRSAFAFTFWFTAKTIADWPEVKRRIRSKFPTVPQRSISEARAFGAHALYLDTRTAAEFAVSRLPGAIHTPDQASVVLALRGIAATRPVLLYCSVGYRSAQLVQALRESNPELGAAQLFNLEGSLFEWVNSGHPLAENKTLAHPFNKNWGGLLQRARWSHEQ